MYPSTDDNYGIDSCSIMCLQTTPPIVVIAMCTGKIYHAILLREISDDDDDDRKVRRAINIAEFYIFRVSRCHAKFYRYAFRIVSRGWEDKFTRVVYLSGEGENLYVISSPFARPGRNMVRTTVFIRRMMRFMSTSASSWNWVFSLRMTIRNIIVPSTFTATRVTNRGNWSKKAWHIYGMFQNYRDFFALRVKL